MSYLGDVAALTHKDLRVELRARDTLPAMLLFVLSTLATICEHRKPTPKAAAASE